MTKRLMRLRVLRDHLVLDGISLPKGDYDGEISWSELPYRGHPNRVRGPSRLILTRALLAESGQTIAHVDASTAITRGDVVVL